VIRFARQAGIRAPIPNSPASALGLAEVSPLEMAAAYTGFATLGTRAEPRIVRRVLATDGTVLWEAEPPARSAVMDPGVAFIVTDMLRDAVDHGTGGPVRDAGFQLTAAGKTGTTSDAADAWFAGYTPDVVGVVWIGFDRRREITRLATGGHAAAPVWGRMMRRIYARWPAPVPWPQPDNVVSLAVDPESGQTLQEGCSAPGEGELFLTSAVPLAVCPEPVLLGRPVGGLGGFLSGIWHSITGRPLPVQLPLPAARTPRGPWDPVLGANRVLMESRATAANP
jgi:penicillin-binding protein 1A